ncbi:MAG: hypothetical protein H8E31_14585 [Planctomycetes bacterium]|nr:hypothetical protein [Planctomycetota bacterium]
MKLLRALSGGALILLLGVAAVALASEPNDGDGGGGNTVRLINREEVSGLDLPIEWFSLRTRQAADPGSGNLGKVLTQDALGIVPAVMPSVLASLSVEGVGATIELSAKSGLALYWEPSVGILEVKNLAFEFGATEEVRENARIKQMEDNLSTTGRHGTAPLSRVGPPDWWRAAPATADPQAQSKARATQSGLGLLEVITFPNPSSRFSAGGTTKEGGDPDLLAWLHVGEDERGGLWFWFQESQ